MDKQKAVRKAVGQEGAFVDMLNQEMKELQDSQKQIEEMYDDISAQLIGVLACEEMSLAIHLYNAGYRKIPKGAVVLTREELQAHDKALSEKIAERVKMAFYYEFDELIPSIMADKIDEICKEFTEGKV